MGDFKKISKMVIYKLLIKKVNVHLKKYCNRADIRSMTFALWAGLMIEGVGVISKK